MNEPLYNVFVQNWWKYVGGSFWPKGLEPCPGRKRYLARGVNYDKAISLCDQYNNTHRPGRLSRKAGFESCRH